MRILAHRGYWRLKEEQNSVAAYERALNVGAGIELDIWLVDGRVLISHDPPLLSFPSFESALESLSGHVNFKKVQYALNIKSDGLEREVGNIVSEFGLLSNAFVFDMSGPSTYFFLGASPLRVAVRRSEHEPAIFEEKAHGVWLDCWESEWFGFDRIGEWLDQGKFVAIVSPELHGRPHQDLWSALRDVGGRLSENMYLCTDFPEDALVYFDLR